MLALLFLLVACAPESTAPSVSLPLEVRAAPVTGGTLAVSGDRVIAAIPGADVLVDARLTEDGLVVVATHALPAGSRPTRVVIDGETAWAALRGAEGVARLGADGVRVFPVCEAPRGLVVDGSTVCVACAEGALVGLDAVTGAARDRFELPEDLRDVVRFGDGFAVSRFRSAEVLDVGPDGEVRGTWRAPEVGGREASVAWRLVAGEDALWLAHQRASADVVSIGAEAGFGTPAYGGPGCDAVVESAVTVFASDGSVRTTSPLQKSVLPVDLVVEADRGWLVAAGATGLSDVAVGELGDAAFGDDACVMLAGYPYSGLTLDAGGQVVAAAAVHDGLVVLTEAPSALLRVRGPAPVARVDLGGSGDLGFRVLHAAASGTVACASCHPEGGEDGRVWRFDQGDGEHLRRTQSLAGGVAGAKEPLHWEGEHAHLGSLLDDSLVRRMGVARVEGDEEAVRAFLADTPRTRPGGDEDAVGEAVFVAAGCASCHAGPLMTDGLVHDVGTTDHGVAVSLATPSLLGLGARGPWMHDGCAATLEARWDPACGGTAHGVPPASADDRAALLRWLRSR